MNPKDWFELLERAFNWLSNRRNPVRRQAVRVLETLEAHGVACTQVNALLPETLRLPAIQWSSGDELKNVLRQEHVDWLNQQFALDESWLTGKGDSAHQHIFSYKAPNLLHQWLQDNQKQNGNLDFKLHLITPDTCEIGPHSAGYYALILEQMDEDLSTSRRFYHLTEGGKFEHGPSLVHLQQVLAIAHYHGAILRRSQLDSAALYQLSHHKGLIPDWLNRCRPHPLEADHELWPHFSGHSPWLDDLRAEAEQGLRRAGLSEVIEGLQTDTLRFSRRPDTGQLTTPLSR